MGVCCFTSNFSSRLQESTVRSTYLCSCKKTRSKKDMSHNAALNGVALLFTNV